MNFKSCAVHNIKGISNESITIIFTKVYVGYLYCDKALRTTYPVLFFSSVASVLLIMHFKNKMFQTPFSFTLLNLSCRSEFETTAVYAAYIDLIILKTIGSYVLCGVLELVMT